ncbi:hypothetical protein BU15DRAFT_67560 [Melanogaster broomeanus]|nr:hypothetical protein BU15DRAFT_67560 [Melanogaster broomeanus]
MAYFNLTWMITYGKILGLQDNDSSEPPPWLADEKRATVEGGAVFPSGLDGLSGCRISTIWHAKVNLIPCAWPMPLSWGPPEPHEEPHASTPEVAMSNRVVNNDDIQNGDEDEDEDKKR